MMINLPSRKDIDEVLAVLPHVDYADRQDLDVTGRHDLGVLMRSSYRLGMDAGLELANQIANAHLAEAKT